MTGLTPKAHTQAVLKRMNLAGSVPGNLNRDNDASGDNYGLASARSSDSSSFQMDGAPKSPHMGRPGRQSGGRISGDLVRTRRTPEETASDIANEDKVVNALAKDRRSEGARDAVNGAKILRMSPSQRDAYANEKDGGRIGRWKGGAARDKLGQKDALASDNPGYGDAMPGEREYYNFIRGGLGTTKVGAPMGKGGVGSDATAEPTNQAKGGRVGRARGGRTKGKTTVNVIIGGQKTMPPPAPMMPPPPMAASGPVGPPRPPMPPPGMGPPPGGAPPGMGGGPPPGMPPMLRARGGRIEISTPGKHDYGKAGVPHGKIDEKYGGGSGLGRQANARRQK
jgi:hypothetical protein